ncbi:MAG: hypothetical protein IIX39_00055, partial [Clostridia bacterium]|nr:hypothetical protein [Clostridia bacterium]
EGLTHRGILQRWLQPALHLNQRVRVEVILPRGLTLRVVARVLRNEAHKISFSVFGYKNPVASDETTG